MRKQAFYNGILYQIEYQPQLSNMDYTRHQVYHIKTEDENALHTRKAIVSVMKDKQEEIKNRQDLSMLNALHVYCKSLYNEGLDVHVYTFVRPYDD